MAIDQREALIAAVRAQVEKEKAAKAAKQKKEEEAMQLAGKTPVSTGSDDKPKYKTLSAEELAKIEENKRRKQAAKMGIVLEEEPKKEEPKKEEPKKEEPKKEEPKKEEPKKEAEGLGMSVGIQPDKSGKSLSMGGLGTKTDKKENKSGLGLNIDLDKKDDNQTVKKENSAQPQKFTINENKKTESAKTVKEEPKKPHFDDEKARLQPTKIVAGNSDVKIISDDSKANSDDNISFSKQGDTTIISDGVTWQETPESSAKTKNNDDIISIVPNRTTPTNDVKSMYDIDDDGEDILGAEISKLANFQEEPNKADFKQASDNAKKAEEAAKRAEAEAAKKAEAEAAKKAAAEEEARKKAEAQKQRMKEAEKRAEEQQRRIAEAAAKARAEEAARKRAEEEARRKEEEEAKRRALEEERKKAAEEARKKAEEEARAKAKQEALKVAEEARKKAEEAAKVLEAAKRAEEEAAKIAEENRKRAEEEAAKRAKEEAKRKAEEEAKRKAEEEAKRKAEEEAKRKAEEEAKRRAEEDAKRKAEEEAKRKAEEEAKKAAEEARKKAEEAMRILEEAKKAEEAALKAAEEARKQAEEDAKKAAEEAAKRKAEDEARKKAEEEARKKAEAEARKKAEEEAKKAAAAALAKKAEEEARKKADEEAKKAEEEARKKAEEARKILEDAKRAEEEALKAAKEAESIKLDLTKPSTDGKLPLAAYYLEKYTGVESLAQNVINTFNEVAKAQKDARNIALLGEHGFGLTSVGEDFARSFYDMGVCKAKTIAKIKAAALNKVKLADAMVKLAGGCLVVENSGIIAADKFNELMDLTSPSKNDVVVILTGEEGSLDRLFAGASNAADKFKHKIKIAGLSNADMINIAKGYVSQRGFKADDSFDKVMRTMLMAMESGNIDRMLKSIDDAMLKCEDREKSKGIEGKKYLLSEDFK